MISVILPTRNDEVALAHALAALVPAAAEGVVREVIVVDSGSEDGTAIVADAAGCRFISGSGARGPDLAAAAAAARSDWLLFLSPDVVLEPGWQREVQDFISRVALAGGHHAAVFRPARAGFGWRARLAEAASAFRAHVLAAPSETEGLLVPARLYREVGGHRPLAGLVEMDLARRIGRRRLSHLRSRAVLRGDSASAGAFRGAVRLALLTLRLPPQIVARLAG